MQTANVCNTEFVELLNVLPNDSKTLCYTTDNTKNIIGISGNLTERTTGNFNFIDNYNSSITFRLDREENNTRVWFVTIKNLTNNVFDAKLILFIS